MKKWIKVSFLFLFVSVFILAVAVGIYVENVLKENRITLNLNKLGNFTNKITLYDNNNSIISEKNQNGTKIIELKNIPQHTKDAFIAIEDNDFYKHNGLNYKRIVKALLTNITSGYAKEGASTITQQLIKNTHLSNEKTLNRKLKEAILALDLEKHYSKDDILETYLNVIYFGNNNYGIEEASQNYFGHSASSLSIEESAALAGMIKSPTLYSPINNVKNCEKRRNIVLKQMKKLNYINEDEYKEAVKKEITVVKPQKDIFSTYNSLVIEEAKTILNVNEKLLFNAGLTIQTFLDNEIQTIIANSLNSNLNKNQHTSAIVINPQNGGIMAYASTLQNPEIKRSPASLIKPILCYGSAFELKNAVPLSPVLDEKISFDDYSPHNIDNKYVGWTTMRYALAHSLNIPAIKTLDYVGIEKAKNFSERFGLNFDQQDDHLALALGSLNSGVTLKQITGAYSAFANMGKYIEPHFIKKITANGKTLYEFKEQQTTACKDSTAFMINDILKDSVNTGTAKTLSNLNLNLCSKTGTNGTKAGKNSDAWNVSYNKDLCIGVWCGNISSNHEYDLEKSQNGGTIATKAALNIWSGLKQNRTFHNFDTPKSIVKVGIDKNELYEHQRIVKAEKNEKQRDVIYDYFPDDLANNLETKSKNRANLMLNYSINNANIILNWEGREKTVYQLIIKSNNKTTNKKLYRSKGIMQYITGVQYNEPIEITLEDETHNLKSNTINLFFKSQQAEIKNPAKKIAKIWLNK